MSSVSILVKVALTSVTVIYPFAVYYGIENFGVKGLVPLLLVLAALRMLSLNSTPMNHWLWLPVLLFLATFTWVSGSDLGVKLYPVLVNFSLLLIFVGSLFKPPSMIERLARIQQPDLPEEAIAYTRKVTQVWSCFFALNGTISLGTTVWGSDQIWALYNGLIAYLLIGLLFAIEWLVRRSVQKKVAGDQP